MTRRALVPLLALVLLTSACTASGGPARPRGHWADAPVAADERGPHQATGPRGDLDAAAFVLLSGVTAVTVRLADLDDDLYRARTAAGTGVAPVARRDGAEVRLSVEGSGHAEVEVTLHRAVRWQLRFAGGVRDVTVDGAGGDVSGVEVAGGAARIGLTLPAPRGTVPVVMSDGAGEMTVRAPAGVPVRLRIGGGAGAVVVDGAARAGIPAGTVVVDAAWPPARDRYDVQLAAGVSRVVVDRG